MDTSIKIAERSDGDSATTYFAQDDLNQEPEEKYNFVLVPSGDDPGGAFEVCFMQIEF